MNGRTTRSFLLILATGFFALAMAVFVAACSEDDNGDEPDPQGTPEELDDTEDIDVIPPELPPEDTDGESALRESCSADEAISWNSAVDHVGNEIALIGPVYEVDASGSETSIVVGSDEVEPALRVEIVLTESALSELDGDPSELFSDAEICAVGVMQSVGGNLRMVVNEPDSLRRL